MDEQPHKESNRLFQAGWLVFATTPFLLAFAGTAWIPQGRPLAETKQLQPLAFRQYAVNPHDVGSIAKVTAPFAFWNRGDAPIEIIRLEPSCGCLAPKLLGNRTEYPPGSQGLFEVHVETARETPGPHTYTVVVHYKVNGTSLEELVTFRCDIPERIVTVTPPELYFYQLSNTPLNEELRVEDHRGKELKVLEAVSTSPHVSLKIGESKKIDDQKSVTPISVSISSNLPPGSHNNVIRIRTDDPDFPSIQIPVFLQGKPRSVQLTSGVTPPDVPRVTPAAAASDETGEKSP